jgi:hypothetical protein
MTENTSDEEADRPAHTGSHWSRLRAWQQVLILVVVAAAILGVSYFIQSAGGDASEATEQCQSRVEDKLKSPATAEFGDSSSSELGKTGDRWEVIGVVDAENGFGATVRLTYKCDMTYVEPMDAWTAALVDVRE